MLARYHHVGKPLYFYPTFSLLEQSKPTLYIAMIKFAVTLRNWISTYPRLFLWSIITRRFSTRDEDCGEAM